MTKGGIGWALGLRQSLVRVEDIEVVDDGDFSCCDWEKLPLVTADVFAAGASSLRGLVEIYARNCSPGMS